ncbi:MAG: DEAD/DEAH box helicase family protein, partial [Spirochaetaceae bacterium]|nr:DEAD/DEAH box helicase family protein [Spirochaetaceae bacterium]
MSPEALARETIDCRLKEAGWALQDMRTFNPAANLGVAVREYPTDSGPADYLLFVDKRPCGVIEAKRDEEGQNLTDVELQSKRYAQSKVKWAIDGVSIRFAYEATSKIIHFTDYEDSKPRSREVFSFFRPETIRRLLDDEQDSGLHDTLRNRMKTFPNFNTEPYNKNFRDCQTRAIVHLENSFSENRPRALIQMATGSGKTFTAITAAYRLLKYAKAKRILFLVDTKNLGQQAEQEFLRYVPNDDPRRFGEIYGVHRLSSSYIPEDSQVCISTIQRMYSILKGEAITENDEETSLNEIQVTGGQREVVYNPKYPPEYFDIIIIDECHRSIYNIWKQVLDYFDAFLIGLTATPDKRTFAFFNENVVSEYSHEQAVIDNVNVGYDTFIIDTDITKHGATIFKQDIEKRDRLTRAKRWELLDEDVAYSSNQLDRDVVNPSQIRAVVKTFRDKITAEIFPGRTEVPKTIIFSKTDSHADDIIQIVREEFGEGNDFCRKITYSVDKADSVLASFRNDYYPRIAVTVDMIATGTDVKPVECLLFMRDVRSRNYFEQMKGRGTRTLNKDDLKKVTPSANSAKTHFVIIDAVGVTQSIKTDSRPLERKPSVALKSLLMSVVMGAKDEDTFTSLANRLTRLDKQMNPAEHEHWQEKAEGVSIHDAVQNLLEAFNPDTIEAKARADNGIPEGREVPQEYINIAQKELAGIAASPFYNPDLREYTENVRRAYEQIIDNTNIDTVTGADWDGKHKGNAETLIKSFRQFIEVNKNEITALSFFYNQTWKTQPLTLKMIQEVHDKMI